MMYSTLYIDFGTFRFGALRVPSIAPTLSFCDSWGYNNTLSYCYICFCVTYIAWADLLSMLYSCHCWI